MDKGDKDRPRVDPVNDFKFLLFLIVADILHGHLSFQRVQVPANGSESRSTIFPAAMDQLRRGIIRTRCQRGLL
jgi:hypothetical protein